MATSITVRADISVGAFDGPLTAYVERSTSATGPWKRIGIVQLTGGRGYFYDNTAPLDTPVWYRFVYLNLAGVETVSGFMVGPVTLDSDGTIILSDPNRPWADIEFSLCASAEALMTQACNPGGAEFVWSRFDGRTQRASVGLFDRLDSQTPADVYGRRKSWDSGARLLTKTLAARDRVDDLFTAGGPLYLRAPAVYGIRDVTIQPQDLADDYLTEAIDQRWPHRIWSFGYTVVDDVLAVQQGTDCANWCAIETFPTFADLTATGQTFGAIAAGETVCPGTSGDGYGLGPYGDGPYGDGG
ncbi:hypothetical protein EAO70_12965 [Streptomyces sp. adm13(2018)]|uniref:hypothetical protein n=1 Tax=Streptomyces sp. adm13(2018) TaxID=2479007 RepID=UPI0011CE898C|nr:hypothetical protein [Streptomyces sp. adm13(2018)]TXS16343.1 hypothetical protein EAO70_12965 [Streptomyces sp. adm13(2018)]